MSRESTVRLMTPEDEPAWRSFISAHGETTLYHTLEWRDFITEQFGHRAQYLIARDGDSTTGILPLFEVSWPVLGTKLISLPYDIGSGGAVAASENAEGFLAGWAMQLARDRGVSYLELRGGQPRPALDALGLRRQEPVIISDMTLESEADVQRRVSSDHRKAIGKASSRGVEVRMAETVADYLEFYSVYLRVFRDFGTPPYPATYFSELHKRFHAGGSVRLFLASVSGRPMGGLLLFCFQRNLVSKFAACLPEAVPLRAYAALYWRAIEFGLAGSFERLSWGTSSPDQTGLIEFKERWGSVSRRAVLYDFDVSGRAPDLAQYYDSNGLSRRIWRKLPLGLTELGGRWLNRWFC